MKSSKKIPKYILFTSTFLILTYICINTSYKFTLELQKDILDFNSTPQKGRKLLTDKDADRVCEKASETVREYFKTGTNPPKEKKFDDDKPHIQAAINYIDKKIELMEFVKKYIFHVLPVVIFLVLIPITIILWPFCIFCCLCNCCCCCCCKGRKCQVCSFFIAAVCFGLVCLLSTIQIATTNKIFTNLSTTSCSIFKLVTEAIEGQPESMPIPKWQGIEGLKSIIKQMSDAVTTATDTANTEFTEAQNELDESVEEWEELIEHDDVNDIKDLTFDYNDHECSTSPGTVVFRDITPYFIKEYGPVTQENTQLYYANKQFEEVTKNARESIKDASEKMEKALKDGVATQLNDAQTKIDDLGSKFDDISEKFADKWLEYGDKVDIHGKKYVKIAFSIIMGLCAILLALIIINCLMCCPLSCLVRILIHVLWNILYLLSIISFLLGTLTGLLGIIGKDGSSIVHYVISKKNLESEKPLLIGEGETTNYINTCINGDGNLKEAFDIGEIMDNLDDLYQIKDTIAEYKKTIKNNNTLFTIDYVQHFKDGKDILPMAYYQKADDGSFQDFDKISAAYSTLNLQTKNNSAEKLNDYWAFKEESTNGYIYKPKPEVLVNFHDKANVKPFLLSLNDDWKFDEMEIIYSNFGVKTRIKNCMQTLNEVQDGVKSLFFDTTNTPPTSTILTNFNNRLTNKYKEVLTTIYDALDVTTQVIDPLYNVLNEYLGDDGSIYDILNCNFIGNNIKVLLSEMYGGFGKNFYSFGFIMGIIGLLSIIGIYCTILTISIGNTLRKQNNDKKESRTVESTAHEGESESKFVMKENR